MDIFGQMAAAAARYQNAEEAPEQDRLPALKARAEHLINTVPAEIADSVVAPTLEHPSQGQHFERVIASAGRAIPPAMLRKGLEATRSVARISSARDPGPQYLGTGFLVSPEVLLTVAHLLPDENAARGGVARFDFERRLDGSMAVPSEFALDPDRFYVTNEALDYTLVAIESNKDGAPGHTYGWCGLYPGMATIVVGEWVQIVGHPLGEPKVVSLSDNEVVHVLSDFLQYSAPTAGAGGSGAPVFNMQWELVAMHHASSFKKSPSGDRWLSEATRVSAIVRSLDEAGILGAM
jgi:V8-like Glu-specific endopeptidase